MTNPKAKMRNLNGKRHYVVRLDGHEYLARSASGVVGILDKPAIAGWMVNTHLDKAHELARKARNIDADDFRAIVRSAVRRDGNPAAESGSRVHEVFEAYFRGEILPDHPETDWAYAAALDVEKEMKLRPLQLDEDVLGVEVTLARIEDGIPLWAGTCDFLGEFVVDGQLYRGAVDWKSGASGLWPDSILTTSIYTAATHYIGPNSEAIPIEEDLTAGALVWVRPEGYAFSLISPEETEDAIEVLRSLAIAWSWKLDARVADPANSNPIRKEAS